MTAAKVRSLAVAVIAFSAAALSAGCNLEPDALARPTYEADVLPIFMSRCIRCHGSPPLGDPVVTPPSVPAPATVRFDVFADTNCDTDGGTGCVRGAAYEAMHGKFQMFLVAYAGTSLEMPPSPAPKLTSYQRDTILKWESENPPLEK
jgi:hypothetical protein